MDQSHLGTEWYVPATSHMGESFIGTKQRILSLIIARKIWTVSLDNTSC